MTERDDAIRMLQSVALQAVELQGLLPAVACTEEGLEPVFELLDDIEEDFRRAHKACEALREGSL